MRKATFDEAGENFYKWNKDNLFTGGHEQFDDKSYEKFAEVLNKTFENYEITSCIRKKYTSWDNATMKQVLL